MITHIHNYCNRNTQIIQVFLFICVADVAFVLLVVTVCCCCCVAVVVLLFVTVVVTVSSVSVVLSFAVLLQEWHEK